MYYRVLVKPPGEAWLGLFRALQRYGPKYAGSLSSRDYNIMTVVMRDLQMPPKHVQNHPKVVFYFTELGYDENVRQVKSSMRKLLPPRTQWKTEKKSKLPGKIIFKDGAQIAVVI